MTSLGTPTGWNREWEGSTDTDSGRTALSLISWRPIPSRDLVYIAFTFPRSDYPRLVSVSMTMGKNIELGRRKELELTIQKVRIMN
jgi:hypothetical protein